MTSMNENFLQECSLFDLVTHWHAYGKIIPRKFQRLGSRIAVLDVLIFWFDKESLEPYRLIDLRALCKIITHLESYEECVDHFQVLKVFLESSYTLAPDPVRSSCFHSLFRNDINFGAQQFTDVARMCVRYLLEFGHPLQQSEMLQWDILQEGLTREEYDDFVSGKRRQEISDALYEVFPDWADGDALVVILDFASSIPKMIAGREMNIGMDDFF